MSEIVILAVRFQLKQLKKQPEKNSGCFFNYLSWKHTVRVTISLKTDCVIHWIEINAVNHSHLIYLLTTEAKCVNEY